MTNKTKNIQQAEKSLQIIEAGMYFHGESNVSVKDQIAKSIGSTFTASPAGLKELTDQELPAAKYDTQIEVNRMSTNEALAVDRPGLKTAVLNFASAKNPGGGFLGGAVAQEESLARSSSLYASLTKDRTLYEFNRSQSTFLYSDYMIYSPEVLFWMDDNGEFLEKPVSVDVITSPAPNKGAMKQNNRPQEIDQIEETFRVRIDKLFALAVSQKVECLILGAWGCGVFQNDPAQVAVYFKEALENKYKGQFKLIVFAIYGRRDESILNTFKEVFHVKS
ncbi:hypothetical protein D3C87_36380 [compost metagenome]